LSRSRPAILAVDGGGSKVDAALLARDGSLIAAVRIRNGHRNRSRSETGPAPSLGALGSAREVDFESMVTAVGLAVVGACGRAGLDPEDLPVAGDGVYCLAGADLPADDRRLQGIVRVRGWTADNLVRNDTFAVLRAGTERPWGVAVVCGHGTNCSGVAPDGRTFRFPAVGYISGDWGGGSDIGGAALWHALRARDGRGQDTMLAELVPDHFGLRNPRKVFEAMHFERIDSARVAELAPVVFRAASEGDRVARSIVNRQAEEVVTMAAVAIRRLRLSELDVDVVLGGGIFRNDDPEFFERIREGLREIAPLARTGVLTAPPVVGAGLLGLDRLGAGRRAAERLRATLTHERLTTQTEPARRKE
jgi:N-acetylglucosamine kinase-like BadF-type ATPase